MKKHRRGSLPDFIIMGAAKCGTTSLHYYLDLHPQISMSREKELDFFVRELNWDKGIDWYQSNFMEQEVLHGEASPSYTAYPVYKGVPKRIYSILPKAKLIYIIRDPIERTISGYIQKYSDGNESRSIENVLTDLEITNPYLCRSRYYLQLSQYLEFFPPSNILVITTEDLYQKRRFTLRRIFGFLNIEKKFYTKEFQKIKHRSIRKRKKNSIGLFLKWLSETNFGKSFPVDLRRNIGKIFYLPFSTKIERPVLNDVLKNRLLDFFKEDIGLLKDYTGDNFESWLR